MDTNHIAQVLQDKKLQKHLNTKINRQFKTCRYIGDIVISEDEYILLKAYLRSICRKYLNTSERYITSPIFAVALVQIGIHKYDGRFWPHVEREIDMELPGSYQKWIGRSFYKTLEKYNKYKVAENEMMNNILLHCFITNYYASDLFDFLFAYYQIDLERDLTSNSKEMRDYLMQSMASGENTARAYKIKKHTSDAVAFNTRGCKIRVGKILRFMDNALFYGLFPRTSQNRIAQLFCKWADESKKFDQAKKAIAGLTKRGEKRYSSPYLRYNGSQNRFELVLPPQYIHLATNEELPNLHWKIAFSNVEKTLEAESENCVTGCKTRIVSDIYIPSDNIFDSIRIELIKNDAEVIHKFTNIRAACIRFFDNNWELIHYTDALPIGDAFAFTHTEDALYTDSDAVYNCEYLNGLNLYSMELIKGDIIRLPDGRALPVGSALEDGLLKNNLKNGVYVMREGVKHPVFSAVPSIYFRMSPTQERGTLIRINEEKYRFDIARAIKCNTQDKTDEYGYILISRDQMIASPPHILITNYAMLEYLMVRPRDSVFFDGEFATHWKFIVFDEAHVYSGSTGIEVSMLFRRLKAKLGNQKITYILTSATLGGKEDNKQVAEFAKKLCSAPFDSSDIVRADRIIPSTRHDISALPIQFYEKIAYAIDMNCPDSEILEIIGKAKEGALESELYDLIVHDRNYWRIRSLLSSPETVRRVADSMNWTQKQLSDFVSVASVAEKNGGKLFDARYHMFLRATESVFVTLPPDSHVMLHRSTNRYDMATNTSFKVFEAATCSFCAAVYLVGKIENGKLEQYNMSDDISTKEVFLLADSVNDTDNDHILEDEGIAAEAYRICPYCGSIHKDGVKTHCEHITTSYVKVYRVKFTTERHTLTKCLHCENVNTAGVLRMFFSGQEASTSVIGTALFQELPSYKVTVQKHDADDEFGDDFGFFETIKEKTAKQFIAFSDSRQAAAFYASYLNISYNDILYKRLIVEALKKREASGGLMVPSFVDLLKTVFEKNNIKGRTSFEADSDFGIQKEAWKAILAELVDSNGNTSLSHFGLIGIETDVSGSYKKYHINENEFRSLCSIFAASMMTDAALKYDAPLNESDLEDFTHGGAEYSYTVSESGKRKKAFIPSKAGLSNKRVDYLQKITKKKGIELSLDDATDFLKLLWDKVFVLRGIVARDSGTSYKVDTSKIRITNSKPWFICKKCRRLTCHNIEDVCPTYQCDGELIPIDPSIEFKENHYYRLFNDMEIRDLRIVEHTAQLDRDMAYEFQKKFKQKEIDILSCSTTFEMGVDVGSLETVFMRNVPPMPSNYAQRAGRAGRSKQSAAFALTFCNKSNHDFSYFHDPAKMIKGKIAPPNYVVENDKIAIRHLYASAMSFFWKIHPELFQTIGQFLRKNEMGEDGFEHLKNYLYSKPSGLRDYLATFLPAVLTEKFDVAHFGWVASLIGEKGVLTEAIQMYRYEIDLLEAVKKQRIEKETYVDGIIQRIAAYEREDILSFLSRKNVLPKYGFPVDTVEMTVTDARKGRGYGLQLQRDLSMAISEYAPGSQIVANNNLITSRYIKKVPKIGWKMYSYIQCDECRTLNITPFTEDEPGTGRITECCQCHKKFTSSPKVFLIPAQGFIADGNAIRKPGLKKPERTYRGEISYVGFNNSVQENIYSIGNAIVSVRSSQNDEMAVLNKSPFYVCEHCGYSEVDEKQFTGIKKKKHKISSGFPCSNEFLRLFSLGYRFLTDVVRIRFDNYIIEDWEHGLSILYGFLRGACSYLNIEENDISGCLQYEPFDGRPNYSIVVFDNTPGGAGHAKRLDNEIALHNILTHTLKTMKGCVCGGEDGDSSCYSCLRSYKNQKYHDFLKRKYVIEFVEEILDERM